DPLGHPATTQGVSGDFQTDDRGIYRIYGLAPGTYVVMAGPSPNGQNFGPGNRLSPYSGNVPIYHPSSTRDPPAEAALPTAVHSRVETGGVDIQYRNEKGHVISGTVAGATTDNNRMGGFAMVTLTHAATGAIYGRVPLIQRGRGGSSNGAFAISGVPEGEFEV